MKKLISSYLQLRRSHISLENLFAFNLFFNGAFSYNDITFHFSLFRALKTRRLVVAVSFIDSANNSCYCEFWICGKHSFLETPMSRISDVVKSLYLSYHFSTNV